ncbi:MAG: helix-turn-helix domain-containing protein [Clostridiaceae bacterium]
MAVTKIYNIDQLYEGVFQSLGISKTSIYRAIATDKLKAIKVGKRYIVSEQALNEFLLGDLNKAE